MTTARELFNGSLRLIGQLAEGEQPSAETSQDCLEAFNQMLESWALERLSVYSIGEQIFTWPAGQSSRTIGLSGNFSGNRPILVEPSTYFVDPSTGISYNVEMVNQLQYNDIALKTVTSTYPQLLYVDASYPDMTLTVYPVPTRDLEWHIFSSTQLTRVENLSDELNMPPGYLRALRYNFACELAPEFGVEPSRSVQRIAMSAKRNIKRINNPDDIMDYPINIMNGPGKYNIYSGNY